MNTRDETLAGVRLVSFDIDGVFTDGRIYVSDDGMESKSFHTQDGFGVRRLLEVGLAVAVISGRRSAAVEKRMSELGVPHVMQGNSDKVAAFEALAGKLGIDQSQALYVGDD
ncbi:MAG: KdsC family phosphatase, partial [Woeseia sp.]